MTKVPTPAHASLAYEKARKAIVEAMRRGSSLRTACGLAGLSPTLVHRWLGWGEDPEHELHAWTVELRRVQAQQIADAEQVFASQRADDPASMRWWLSRMDRHTYGDEPTVIVQAAERLPDATPEEVAAAIRGGK
jgi:hypothetical protein